jgi:hypothetical protein
VKNFTKIHISRDIVVCIETRLPVGQSGFWIPVLARDFCVLQNVHTGTRTHTASYWVSTRSRRSVILTTHLHLTPRLAVHLLPLYAFMAWTVKVPVHWHLLAINTCYWQATTDEHLKQGNAEVHHPCSRVLTQTSVRPLNAVGSSVTRSTFSLQTPISADRECFSLQFTC